MSDLIKQRVLRHVRQKHGQGVTWKELAAEFNMHHGSATSALSSLHKEGTLSRLTEKRDNCSIYVDNKYVYNRETAAYGRKNSVTAAQVDEAYEDAYKNVAIVVNQMLAAAGKKGLGTHFAGCWRTHVPCALIVIGKQIESFRSA